MHGRRWQWLVQSSDSNDRRDFHYVGGVVDLRILWLLFCMFWFTIWQNGERDRWRWNLIFQFLFFNVSNIFNLMFCGPNVSILNFTSLEFELEDLQILMIFFNLWYFSVSDFWYLIYLQTSINNLWYLNRKRSICT